MTRITNTNTIQHVGTLRLTTGVWELYDQYPTSRRDYKITSAVREESGASIAFTTDHAFECWLVRNQQPVQSLLF